MLKFKKTFYALMLAVIFLNGTQQVVQQIENFLEFGPEHGDEAMIPNDDLFVGPINISVTFPFFNRTFNSLYVNTNGLVSFDSGITDYTPIPFPLKGFTAVAPFWTDIDTREGGDVFYREILDQPTLALIANEIRRAFTEFYNFRPTFAYVVTWYRVAAYQSDGRLRNTFQAIVSTNGKFSFTIYNYQNLTWAKNPTANIFAQAGFNAGDGNVSFAMEGSLTQNVILLNNKSNINIPGKWIFRIDENEIADGGCNEGGFLTFTPSIVSFLGHEDLLISGPCFEPDDAVEVHIGQLNKTLKCDVLNSVYVQCETQYFEISGGNSVKMTINQNRTFTGGLIVKGLQERERIDGLNEFYIAQHNLTDNVTITWNPVNSLSDDDLISIYYILVDELGEENFHLLKPNISINQSSETINFDYINDHLVKKRLLGNLTKSLANFIAIKWDKIKDGGIKVGKWIHIGSSLIIDAYHAVTQPCQTWYNGQPDPTPILLSLPPCWPRAPEGFPRTFGEFKQDDACRPKPGSCGFHPGATACYRSANRAPYAQQCCYDRNRVLLVGPPAGGTLDMSNSDLSLLEHLWNDVRPWIICCKIEDMCDLYYEKRPSDDGSRWQPPPITGGSGDPHFLTLDESSYTFNGFGEYTLLDVPTSQFTIQVRLGPLLDQWRKPTDGTVFKAISVKDSNDIIQIELNVLNRVDVYYNGVMLDFDSNPLDSLTFDTLSLIIAEDRYFIKSSKQISVEVQLTSERNALSIISNVAKTFNGKTRGLLGYMDQNPANDFMLPDGTILTLDSKNDREIFSQFGQRWMTTANTSIFTYEEGFQHADFVDFDYEPKFISDGITFDDAELQLAASQLCQNNTQCMFDIATTKQLSIGNMTVEFNQLVETYEQFIETVQQTCVRLYNPVANADVSVTETSSGFIYTVRCHDTFCMQGNSTVVCESGQTGNFPKCELCEEPSTESTSTDTTTTTEPTNHSNRIDIKLAQSFYLIALIFLFMFI